jgi:hypothetical protein
MSILIKGMMMPKNCAECVFSEVYDYEHGDGDEFTCELTRAFTYDYAEYKVKRLPSCPLIELPPHGDLIDRDERADFVARTIEEASKNAIPINETYLWQLINEMLVNAPTIIPAEEGENP